MTQTHVSTLLSTEQIAARVRELGAQITSDYEGRRLVLVSVLKGSFIFQRWFRRRSAWVITHFHP